MIALALDPGAHAGLAVVVSAFGDDPRPRLMHAAGITAGAPSKLRGLEAMAEAERLYLLRARTAILQALLPYERGRWQTMALGIEWRESAGIAGDRAEEIYRLGGRRATLSSACEAITGRCPALMPQQWWVEIINTHHEIDIPRGKIGVGHHRVDEASARLAGAADLLMALPKNVRVDAAEAALMALALVLDAETTEDPNS